MGINKKFICMALCMIICTIFIGCQDAAEEKTSVSDTKDGIEASDDIAMTSFPDEYERVGGHVDMEIMSIEPTEAYFIDGTAKHMDMDFEALGRKLIPDSSSSDADIAVGQLLSENQIDGMYEKMFLWGDNMATFYTYHGVQLNYSIYAESKASDYNLDLYADEKSFSFGDADSTLEIVKSDLEELGIEIDSTYCINTYYLDHETMKEQEKHYDMNGEMVEDEYKKDWSEADDAYMFCIHQTYCGLLDFHTLDNMSVRADEGSSQITVIYGSEGILYMQIQDMSIYEKGTEQVELMSFDDIADIVIEQYDYILDDASYKISDAKLICDFSSANSGDDKKIIPVWVFYVEETDSEGITVNYELRVNANNGNIIN